MMKRLAIIMALMFSYMSAQAQIAIPKLDPVMKVQNPAAAGWRAVSTVGIQAVTAEGKVKADGDEIGDADLGAAAKASLPAITAAFKGETLAAELFYNAGTVSKSDVETGDTSNLATLGYYTQGTQESEDTLPETRLNLAFVFGEILSVGLGYRENKTENETSSAGNIVYPATATVAPYSADSSSTITETGLMLGASLMLGEMFYLAGGMENVSYKYDPDSGASDKIAWTNTILGLGLKIGEPGNTQFRVEYDMISSPEADGDDDIRTHYKTDKTIMSLEALFGSFLLSYNSQTEKVDNADKKTVITEMGLGWIPEEGLTVGVYSFDYKKTYTSSGMDIESNPKGWRVSLGWNF